MITLKDIDTSKFLFDPKSKKFVEEIGDRIPEFKEYTGSIDIKKLATWIALMYDVNSKLNKHYPDYFQRKYYAATLSGFKPNKNGKFKEEITNFLIGKDDNINKLIVTYVNQFGLIELTQLVGLMEVHKNLVQGMMSGDFNDKTPQTLQRVVDQIDDITKKLYGSGQEDEITNAKRSLYAFAESKRLQIRPEDFADRLANGDNLSEFSPYGDGYESQDNRMLFLGDSEDQAEELTNKGYGRTYPEE